MAESNIVLRLDCRQCIDKKIRPRIHVGLTADGHVEVECARGHGKIVNFASDGSSAEFATGLLQKGCELCGKGVRHVH